MPQPLVGFVAFRAFPTLAAVTVSGPLPSCHYEITNAGDPAVPRNRSCPVPRGTFAHGWDESPPNAVHTRRADAFTGGALVPCGSRVSSPAALCRFHAHALRVAVNTWRHTVGWRTIDDGRGAKVRGRSARDHPPTGSRCVPVSQSAPRSRWLQGFAPPAHPYGSTLSSHRCSPGVQLLLQGR